MKVIIFALFCCYFPFDFMSTFTQPIVPHSSEQISLPLIGPQYTTEEMA